MYGFKYLLKEINSRGTIYILLALNLVGKWLKQLTYVFIDFNLKTRFMDFHYLEDFKKLTVICPPQSYKPKNMTAFRWIFDDIDDEKKIIENGNARRHSNS